MKLRRYGDFPAMFVPDEGEVVLAARTPAGPFLKAAVVRVRRASRDSVRVDFVWWEDGEHTLSGVPNTTGGKGHVYITADDPVPLIRRIPANGTRRTVPAYPGTPGTRVRGLKVRSRSLPTGTGGTSHGGTSLPTTA